MAYIKNVWQDEDVITDIKMNNIEDGISNAHQTLDSINNGVQNIVNNEIPSINNEIGELKEQIREKTLGMKSLCIYHGYPISMSKYWVVDEAVSLYGAYDIVVLGTEYQNPSHEAHSTTREILAGLEKDYPDTEVFGTISCATTNSIADVKARVEAWSLMGVKGVCLSSINYYDGNNRARQNEIFQYAKDLDLICMAQTSTADHILDSSSMEVSGTDRNPNQEDSVLDANDYILFDSVFFNATSSGQLCKNGWSAFELYDYFLKKQDDTIIGNDPETKVTWYEKYGTRMIGLDRIHSNNNIETRLKLMSISILGGRLLNLHGIGFGNENLNTSGSYEHYALPKIPLESTVLNKIRATVVGVPVGFEATVQTIKGDEFLNLSWEVQLDDSPLSEVSIGIELNGKTVNDAWKINEEVDIDLSEYSTTVETESFVESTITSRLGDISMWTGTKEQYDAIPIKDNKTLYLVKKGV